MNMTADVIIYMSLLFQINICENDDQQWQSVKLLIKTHFLEWWGIWWRHEAQWGFYKMPKENSILRGSLSTQKWNPEVR